MVEILGKEVVKDSATLATQTFLAVDTTISALIRPFLLTKVKVACVMEYQANLTDALIAVLAYGSPTISEIAAALNSTVVNSEGDPDNYRENQVHERRIIDFVAISVNEVVSQKVAFNWEPHLPKGGLPCLRGGGFQWGVYNASTVAALADGPLIRGLTRWMGAWLSS